MSRGEPTSEETIAKFRAHYLYSGNVSASARAVGIATSTAFGIQRKIVADPSFAKDRQSLHAQELTDLRQMRRQVAEIAMDRFSGELTANDKSGDSHGNVTIIDKRPDYGKLVLDAEKNAHNLAKIEKENDGGESKPTEVHITVSGPPSGDEA